MNPKITEAQAALLTRAIAASANGIYIYGSEVRTARTLEKLGLVDDGKSDGERWSIEKPNCARCTELLNMRGAK